MERRKKMSLIWHCSVMFWIIGMVCASGSKGEEIWAAQLDSSAIVNYANGRVGSSYPSGYCLRFVEESYQNLGASRPYNCCAYKSGSTYIVSTSQSNIPAGATVYFGKCGGGPCRTCKSAYYGHVGIYVGNGYFVHATGGTVQKSALSGWADKYRGWGYCGNFSLKNTSDSCSCSESYKGNYTVSTSQYPLTMRSGHGTSYSIVTTIPKGSQVYVSKAGDSWAHVEWNGYKGYCSMQYLTKVTQSVSAPGIHAWISDKEMGTPPGNYKTGTGYYLCYEIVDQASGKKFNEIADADYQVTETVYNPNGSQLFSHTYEKSDNNWIRVTPTEAGTYRGKVSISGDYIGEVEVSFDAVEHKVVLKAWLSETKMGSKATEYRKGVMYYLCYQIIDTDTGKITSDLANESYSVKETIYKPDGSIGHTYTYHNSTDNWIGHCFDMEGTYRSDIEISIYGKTLHTSANHTVAHTHTYTSETTRQASCNAAGIKTYTCSCGDTYTRAIAKLSHTVVEDKAQSATCFAEGKTKGSHCSVCGTVIEKQEIIPKLSHKNTEIRNVKVPTCTDMGYSGDVFCRDCGEKISAGRNLDKTEHKWDSGVITKPAASESGIRTFTCMICKETKTEIIPGTGGNENSSGEDPDVGADDATDPDAEADDTTDYENKADDITDSNTETDFFAEVGDVFWDIHHEALYEVLSTEGAVVNVEYLKPANRKVSCIKICDEITTEEGIVCNVTSISREAFRGNKSVQKIEVGSNVASIGVKAFYKCKNLRKLTFKSTKLTAKSIGRNSFKGISSHALIQAPKSKLKLYRKLFRKKGLSRKVRVEAL